MQKQAIYFSFRPTSIKTRIETLSGISSAVINCMASDRHPLKQGLKQ